MALSKGERRRRIKDLIESNDLPFSFFFLQFNTPPSTYNKWKAGDSAPREAELLEIEKRVKEKKSQAEAEKSKTGEDISWNIRPGGFAIVGETSATDFKTAIHESDERIDLSRTFQNKGDVFAWRVKGNCMEAAGIKDRDLVFIKLQENAEDRDIVLARANGDEATLKYFRKVDAKIWLEAADPDHKKIHGDKISIIGVYVGLLRKK